MNHLLRIIRNTVYRFWLTMQCRVTLKFQLNYFISSAFNYYLNRRCHTYRAVWANLFKSQVSPRVCCFVVFGLFVCFSGGPAVLVATDAQQLPAFVERESLADMRVLNSAPASRSVPLYGSQWARGLPLFPLSCLIFFLPLSLFLISFLSVALSAFRCASRAHSSLAHRR